MPSNGAAGKRLRGEVFVALTETMLDLTNIQLGDHVLELAAGMGELAVMTARRVGSATSVAPQARTPRASAGVDERAADGTIVTRRDVNAHMDDCVEAVTGFGVISCLSISSCPSGNETWEMLIGVRALSMGHPVSGAGAAVLGSGGDEGTRSTRRARLRRSRRERCAECRDVLQPGRRETSSGPPCWFDDQAPS